MRTRATVAGSASGAHTGATANRLIPRGATPSVENVSARTATEVSNFSTRHKTGILVCSVMTQDLKVTLGRNARSHCQNIRWKKAQEALPRSNVQPSAKYM